MLAMKMRAALFYGPRDVRLEYVEVPRATAGEVIVKVEVALTWYRPEDLSARTSGAPEALSFPVRSRVRRRGDGGWGGSRGVSTWDACRRCQLGAMSSVLL